MKRKLKQGKLSANPDSQSELGSMFEVGYDEFEESYLPVLLLCLKHELNWLFDVDYEECKEKLAELLAEAELALADSESVDQKLNRFLDMFYNEWAFSSTVQQIPSSFLNSVSYAINYRTGSSMSLALVMQYFLEELQFDSEIVVSNDYLNVHVLLSNAEGYLIDPCAGNQNWYIDCENDEKRGADFGSQGLDSEELLKLFLSHQKWAFIAEKRYLEAFHCVDLLMQHDEEDPYERRDRGYILQHLERNDLAKDDLNYFVEECPEDPTIELVQSQISELEENSKTYH